MKQTINRIKTAFFFIITISIGLLSLVLVNEGHTLIACIASVAFFGNVLVALLSDEL